MQAKVGDRIVIKGHHIGEPDRDCQVIEVHGPDGGPPYLVRWEDSAHETLFFRVPTPPSSHTSQPFDNEVMWSNSSMAGT